jgi:hypothetical protein
MSSETRFACLGTFFSLHTPRIFLFIYAADFLVELMWVVQNALYRALLNTVKTACALAGMYVEPLGSLSLTF